MTRRLISTGSPFEAAFAYSRAVAQGDWCFVSGVTGYNYTAMEMPSGVGEQTANCMKTIASVLAEAGFAMSDVVRVQYTLSDHADIEAAAPEFVRAFGAIRPAATLVVAGLLREEMKIEIEVTAFRG